MPVLLTGLLADRSLGLRAMAGLDRLDRPITWVHVSELTDPTPFLQGGELLLTTGLSFGDGTDADAFVRRLSESGVSGLGFGVGLSHDVVPPALVAASARHGLPLLEVSRETPFIALSKAVSAALAADAYAEVTKTNAAQRELTRAAVGKAGAAGVVRRLAKILDAWALLVSSDDTVLAAAPASAGARASGLAADLDRLRARGGPSSAAFDSAGDAVVAQALGSKPRSLLVVGRAVQFDRADQHVVNSAAALVTLALARSSEQDRARRRLRTGALRLLLAGQTDVGVDAATDASGGLPEEPLHVLCGVAASATRLALLDVLETEAAGWFFAEHGQDIVVLAPARAAELRRAAGFAHRVSGVTFGVSAPVGHADIDVGLRQARETVAAAVDGGETLLRFGDVSGRGLVSLLPATRARTFAQALLGPLIEHDETGRGELVSSLREWLAHHGQWDPAAARLGVHRHTLRNRIDKAARLLGADLNAPGVRAELWLALQALDLASAEPPPT